MKEKRQTERERSFAPALLPDVPAFGYIADLSSTGVRIRIPGRLPRVLVRKEILLVSFDVLSIPPFRLEVEYRWSRQEGKSTLIGFLVGAYSDEKCHEYFESLLGYYRTMKTPDD